MIRYILFKLIKEIFQVDFIYYFDFTFRFIYDGSLSNFLPSLRLQKSVIVGNYIKSYNFINPNSFERNTNYIYKDQEFFSTFSIILTSNRTILI